MTLPLSRLGVCGASALAGTVAGMVPSQNTPKPTTAAVNVKTTSRRNIRPPLPIILGGAPRPEKHQGGASMGLAALQLYSRGRPAGCDLNLRWLLAISVVAAAAILTDLTHRRLEAVEVL